MRAHYIPQTDPESLVDPEAPVWSGAAAERLSLTGTPLALQPTPANRGAWAGKKIEAVEAQGRLARMARTSTRPRTRREEVAVQRTIEWSSWQ